MLLRRASTAIFQQLGSEQARRVVGLLYQVVLSQGGDTLGYKRSDP